MAAQSSDDPGTDLAAGIEISAGSLHLRSWTGADGDLPAAVVAPAAGSIVFSVLHATTGERLAVLVLDRNAHAGTATVRCWVEPAGQDTDVAERAVATVQRWAAAELGLSVDPATSATGSDADSN